jgi:hypothetical protein
VNERAETRRDYSIAKHNAKAELKLELLKEELATFPSYNKER